MTSIVINISSDSESSDDNNSASKCLMKKGNADSDHSETISNNPQIAEDDNLHEQKFVENQLSVEKIPLFKIIFRDELISRKYRQRIQDIINYVLTTQLEENENTNISSPDLLLEIYDPNDKMQLSETSLTSVTVTNALSKNNNRNKRKLQCNIQSKRCVKKSKHKHQPQDQMIVKNITNVNNHSSNNDHNLETHTENNSLKSGKVLNTKNVTNVESHSSNNDHNLETHTENNLLKSEKAVELVSVKEEDISDKIDDLEISLFVESVEIGSYKYSSVVKTVSLSEDGLTFFVPTFKYEKQLKVISIELDSIVKVLVHFSKTKPALFFFVTNVAAKGIRESLNMDDQYGPYLDPESKKLIHQHIVFLPKSIHDRAEHVIKELFKNKDLIEIDAQAVDNHLFTENSICDEVIPLQTNNDNDKNQLKTSIDVFSSDLNIDNDMETILFCHIIKVGSYEYAKKRVFSISKNNIKFCIPLINESTTITLTIKMDEIEKIAISSSDVLKVFFLYVSSSAAKVIRKTLGMKKSKTPYFNPKMQDGIHDKIIIFPLTIPDDCPVIKKLNKQGKIEKLDQETANNILLKSFQNTENDESKSNKDTNSISLETKSLKIGSYKCDFMQLNVTISKDGLGFQIPDIRESNIGFKYIKVPIRDLQKVSFHMSESLNVLFCYISKGCANRIKYLYALESSLKFNRIPMGTRAVRKIVIEFRKISSHNEILLKNLLTSVVKVEEIIPVEFAQRIL